MKPALKNIKAALDYGLVDYQVIEGKIIIDVQGHSIVIEETPSDLLDIGLAFKEEQV